MIKSKKWVAVGAACLCASGFAYAGQTISYTYDALGRLVQVQTQGGSGNSFTQIFTYDSAGNRKEYQTLLQVALSMNSPLVSLTSAGGATITVNISNPSAGGTVTVSENGSTLGSATVVNGQARVPLKGLSKGSQTIVVSYSGDGADAPQTTTLPINVQNLGWLPAVLQLLLQ